MLPAQSCLLGLVLILVGPDGVLEPVVFGQQLVVDELVLAGLAPQDCYLLLVVVFDLGDPGVVAHLSLAGLQLQLQPLVLLQQPLVLALQGVDLAIALVVAFLDGFWLGLIELGVVSVVEPLVVALDELAGTQKK